MVTFTQIEVIIHCIDAPIFAKKNKHKNITYEQENIDNYNQFAS